jgi:hypothetical protein
VSEERGLGIVGVAGLVILVLVVLGAVATPLSNAVATNAVSLLLGGDGGRSADSPGPKPTLAGWPGPGVHSPDTSGRPIHNANFISRAWRGFWRLLRGKRRRLPALQRPLPRRLEEVERQLEALERQPGLLQRNPALQQELRQLDRGLRERWVEILARLHRLEPWLDRARQHLLTPGNQMSEQARYHLGQELLVWSVRAGQLNREQTRIMRALERLERLLPPPRASP